MAINTIKIDASLLNVLKNEFFKSFTVKQVRDLLLESSKEGVCPIQMRRLVYRELTRLVNKSLLTKQGDKCSHNLLYKKTKLFSKVMFVEKPSLFKVANELHLKCKTVEAQLKKVIQGYQLDIDRLHW